MIDLTYLQLYEKLTHYDVITFDVFDTLIARTVVKPTDVFSIIQEIAKENEIIDENVSFFTDRINAEQQSYKEYGDMTTIDTIYFFLEKYYNYSNIQCEYLKNIEIETELNVVIPRHDILRLVKELLACGKRVLLCSDMYLQSEIINKIILKCGYPDNLEIWVSCEKGVSKNSGKIWDKLFNCIPQNAKTIHIGDNEWADYKTLMMIGREAICINKGYDIFKNSEMFDYLAEYIDETNIIDPTSSLILGYFINNTCYNSPFLNGSRLSSEAIWMGFPFACFMDWLLKTKDESLLLFLTREGFILKPIYEKFCEAAGEHPQENKLFYASRTATLAATVISNQDILDVMQSPYEGTIAELLKSRFNYEIYEKVVSLESKIVLPKDSQKVFKEIQPFVEDIIANGKRQNEAYIKYIESVRGNTDKKITIVDVGYTGTVQYALKKILNEDVSGKYMFLNSRTVSDTIYNMCKALRETNDEVNHPILDNLLFMEATMQVPYGQLKRVELINGKVNHIFDTDTNLSEYISNAQKQFEEFVEWIGGWRRVLKNSLNLDFDLAEKIWILMIKFDFLPRELLESFWISDNFAGHPLWRFEIKSKEWIGKYRTVPLLFEISKSGEKLPIKYRLKKYVKKYIPSIAYEFARKVWIEYIK